MLITQKHLLLVFKPPKEVSTLTILQKGLNMYCRWG